MEKVRAAEIYGVTSTADLTLLLLSAPSEHENNMAPQEC